MTDCCRLRRRACQICAKLGRRMKDACRNRPLVGVALVASVGMFGCSPRAAAPPAEGPATVVVLPALAPALRPAASEEPPPVPIARSEWHRLSSANDLQRTLQSSARLAVTKGFLPVLYVGRTNCEPCESLKGSLDDPRMQDAFAGTYVMEIDMDSAGAYRLTTAGININGIPAFFVLDADGRYHGSTITGAAWGDDIPENMAPPLTRFFSEQRAR